MSDVPEILRLGSVCAVASDVPSDRDRIRDLVGRHLDLAGRVIRNLGAPADEIDDLLQQAFSITAARIADIDVGKERAFLVQTAVRLAANARRRRAQAREVTMDEFPDVADAAPSPEELSDQRRALRVLDGVLESMDIDLRTVFVLYEVEEMTTTEIAAVLHIPVGTVASRLRRARDTFLARLRRTELHDASQGVAR